MSRKKKDKTLEEYLKLQNKIKMDKVDEVFRTQPDNYISALEELGFTYYDDDDYEEIEEAEAQPENQNQNDLVAYFDGKKKFSDRMLKIYFEEQEVQNPNLPLIRKYFKTANQNLKSLIFYGLDHYPGRLDLLSDLGYFHEFENMLSRVITYYTRACVDQENLETFAEIAREFYYTTLPDGYDALYALRDLFEPGTDKREIIDILIAEQEEGETGIRSIDPGSKLH